MPTKDLLTPQTTKELIREKLTALRSLMTAHQLDTYLIPAIDEHLNLSLPEAKQRRAWVSGFTGSAGDLLVGQDQVWLFVDSRYHEQAELQVDSSLISVSKLGTEGHLTLEETLEKLVQAASNQSYRLGFDPFTLAVNQFTEFQKRLTAAGSVELVPLATNLVDMIRTQSPWAESEPVPAYGNSKIFSLPVTLTGETTEQKLIRVRQAMQQAKTDILPVTNLNQVAWLFNLRGADIPCIPIFYAYAIITSDQAYLFTNLERISAEQQALHQITLLPYEQYAETLKTLSDQTSGQTARILLDPKHTTAGTYQLLVGPDKNDTQVVMSANPIEGMKARKNAVELQQMKTANLKASRAKVRTLKWLSEQPSNVSLSELDVRQAIETFYQQEADYQHLAFKTIVAAGANSSIVHYGTPSPQEILQPGELVLLDSGVQYLAGTTDDTRTVVVGEPTAMQISRYTSVLMCHINCAMQRFPKGSTGIQLDAIARSSLWQLGLDYGHGTGHGVGAFLSCHEGPNGISKRADAPLEPGMITSIEPGYYEPGWGGIRIENLYVVKELPSDQGTVWYGFEALTHIPFDKRLIDLKCLLPQQREWLEQYNLAVVEKLTPTLDSATAEWLKEACI